MLLKMDSYRTFLAEELGRRVQANPKYSQRAFARDLGLSPGELSEILADKRKLSHKSVRKIARALSLNPAETDHLHQLIEARPDSNVTSTLPSREMSLDMFHVISDWYCMALVNLTGVEGFRWELRWIADRLGISVTEARLAIERLRRVGIVEEARGRLHVRKDHFVSPDGIPSEAIRNYHKQILALAARALELQPVAEREISGVGLPIDARHVSAIKKEISAFLDHIVAKYSRGRKTAVYQLEAAFFRLTQGDHHETR